MKKFTVLILFCFISLTGFSQKNIRDSVISTSLIKASYNFQLPAGNLADRFGTSSALNLGYSFKTKKNFLLGFDFYYMFGEDVKEENILDIISTPQGFVIDKNGTLSEPRFYERGILTGLYFGKIFPVGKPNPNSGITVTAGVGYFQHKIRIEDIGNNSPQLAGELKKGYDRLTGGLALTQFAGYTFLGNNKIINFFAGIEVVEGFTKSMRSYDYSRMQTDNTQRIDILYGIRAGWILPLYKRSPRELYLY